ncbi:hypothetical protein I302_100866 [Kwoniella bestiolae CBS 10118]|uniref:Uncharacterized protein n=1 Tax=Kwoniella bestiolae CBS 10118 TaxID=1296100 RepID=A0A1B9G690_9TREE|nr:hypothetical protein I302_04240 [Kwoniella bestiolae CBS 10118]OCF26554.1 hypothetical protein I302_04240 [Kwoniella bestiolae CBS 10118]
MSLPGSSELPIMANYGPHPGYPNGPTIDPATHNLLHGPFPYPPSERICYCPGCSQSRGSADYPQFQDTVAVRAPSQYTQDFAQPFPGMLLHYGYGNESYGYGNETYGAWGPDAMAETFVPPMGPGEYMPLDHSYTSGSYPAPYFPGDSVCPLSNAPFYYQPEHR